MDATKWQVLLLSTLSRDCGSMLLLEQSFFILVYFHDNYTIYPTHGHLVIKNLILKKKIKSTQYYLLQIEKKKLK